ncbi:hypothetical protein [Geminicoccus harenae]|uniref:hypothetical protein n=1 Tax=Geminicoccus harenae TaxID=2498453 RepID=UPI00168ACBF4|nr:hypothetical protein [Geminicoccus harenae]
MSRTIQEHRQRLAERGLKRLEVSVAASDADLMRKVAKVLNGDDIQSERLRAAVQEFMPGRATIKFEDWIKAP